MFPDYNKCTHRGQATHIYERDCNDSAAIVGEIVMTQPSVSPLQTSAHIKFFATDDILPEHQQCALSLSSPSWESAQLYYTAASMNSTLLALQYSIWGSAPERYQQLCQRPPIRPLIQEVFRTDSEGNRGHVSLSMSFFSAEVRLRCLWLLWLAEVIAL